MEVRKKAESTKKSWKWNKRLELKQKFGSEKKAWN